MDAKQTGAFIAQLRKEKAYTQKELAQQLHVSDKAISRWETGKGFPDTALLKPLGDALGVSVGELLAGQRIHESRIKDHVDGVLVESMQDSQRKVTAAAVFCAAMAVLVLVVGCAAYFLLVPKEPSAADFVNGSQTSLLYPLTDDNMYIQITYGDYEKREFDGGYEYFLPGGTERYVFTHVPGYSEHPVMSYMHCSGSGTLFGISLGEDTVIEQNPILGVQKDYSLMKYLEENGFKRQFDAAEFGRPNVVYIAGERCNWIPYTKDNVFINLCISAYEGRRLLAYDIGLIDDSVDAVLEQVSSGFSLTLEDPFGVVTSPLQETYRQWDSVTITAGSTGGYETLYLYINGQMIGKLSPPNPPFTSDFQITFDMWGSNIAVLVTPEYLVGGSDAKT